MAELVRVAIIGMGGFASSHHHAVAQLEQQGLCRLICASARNPESYIQLAEELSFGTRGVKVYHDYRQMLDEHKHELEVVAVPSPVPLHAEMHAAGVERDLAVYLEKPPTLDYAELERMIEIDTRAKKRTLVAFNFIVEEPRQALKRRLISGEFGRLRQASFFGLWPRPASYYARTYWAGKLTIGDQLVLDSCMGNAQAHFVHNMLHWAGVNEVASWGQVKEVAAELYRAHDLESFDTVFAKAVTEDGIQLKFAQSHACDGDHRHLERVICEEAKIEYDVWSGWRIEHRDGRVEEGKTGDVNLVVANMAAYFAYLRGAVDRPVTSLTDSRPFVHLYDLAIISGGNIHQVAEMGIRRSHENDQDFVAIEGLDEAVSRFLAEDLTPSEQGLPWGVAGGRAHRGDLPRLASVIASMRP